MKNLFFYIFIFIIFYSCKKDQKFQQTVSGIEYLFVEHNDTAQSPNYGDGLVLDMRFYWNDSLLFNSREISMTYRLKLFEPSYKGCIYEGLAMMSVGDSAIFKVDAYSFFTLTAEIPSPDYIKKGDKLTFYIRLIDIMTPEEILIEQERIRRLKIKNEQDLLKDYLILNELTQEPIECGIYFNELKKGAGKTPEIGDSVTVHYEGKLITNEVFDSSLKRGNPFSFVFGDTTLIKGWNLGVAQMKEGGKAIIVIPSCLAYGETGVGNLIPPYSTVIFEIHLLDVKKN